MKTLVVQKRLAYPPASLDRQSASFVEAIEQMVREAREKHQTDLLELADIGFVPAGEYIEVKLYFRQPVGLISGRLEERFPGI